MASEDYNEEEYENLKNLGQYSIIHKLYCEFFLINLKLLKIGQQGRSLIANGGMI